MIARKRPTGKTRRVQFHLGERTVERLGVHCAVTHRPLSAVVDEVLTAWLSRYGRGRTLFPAGDATLAAEVADRPGDAA